MLHVLGGFRWERTGVQMKLQAISHDHIGAGAAISSAR
jgi:hypothetical protein